MFLKDRASEVRSLGLSKLQDLMAVYKIEWALGSFLNKVQETLHKDNGFVIIVELIILVVQNDCIVFNLIDCSNCGWRSDWR